ncbi:MAG: hypothetical protein MUC36_19150 [Planctomycetes bacterium]|nr:hypothetical protein [Planctomycetota bacterium]
MVHGQGGRSEAWTDPGYLGLNFDYEGPGPKPRNHGSHPLPPLPGTLPDVPPQLDRRKPVSGIQPYLRGRGFSTVVYTQHASGNSAVEDNARELAALIASLVQQTGGAEGNRPIALLAHSRGGLVVRKFLKDHGGTDLTKRLTRVITLVSPHHGSQLANLSVAAGVPIEVLVAGFSAIPAVGPLLRSAFAPIAALLSNDSRQDLQVNSPFLRRLSHGEAPLPGVRYVTFGGTSVTLTRIWQYVYAADSFVPQRLLPPSFRHRSVAMQWPMISPFAETIPAPCDELRHGHGDGLVTNERSKLPFALHRTMHVNHGEILWDERTKVEIADLLS